MNNMKQYQKEQMLMLNPLYLFNEEIKNKTIKKQSIQNAFTIALAMTTTQIVDELLPLMTKIIIQQNNQIRVIAVQSLTQIFELVQSQFEKLRFFQWTVDILCVFEQQQIRKESYKLLNLIIKNLSKQIIKKCLKQAVKELIQNSQKNIRQVTLQLIFYYYESEQLLSKQDEKQLFQLLNNYKTKSQDKIILAKALPKFVQLVPSIQIVQLKKIIQWLFQLKDSKINVLLIETVLKLRQKTSQNETLPFLEKLIGCQDSSVKCQLINNFKRISTLFKSESLQGIIEIFQNFVNQNHDVKNAILKTLQNAPVDQNCLQQIKKPLNSMELKNSLIQSLCRINDIQTLKKIAASSDNDFKSKMYPKLPSLSEFHIQIIDCLLQQKNFRSKLVIIQNVEKRIDQGQNGQILLQTLIKYLGQKTAIVRTSIQKLICKILKKSAKINESFIINLKESLSKQNWFQRQSGYLLLKDLFFQNQDEKKNQQIIRLVKQLLNYRQEKVSNILTIINQIKFKLNNQIFI